LGGLTLGAGGIVGGLLGLGLVVAHLPILIAAGVALIPLAGGTAGGYRVARSHRAVLSSVQLALEQILDRLEHGEIDRPGLLGAIAARPRLTR
jgi:hypothetical protein